MSLKLEGYRICFKGRKHQLWALRSLTLALLGVLSCVVGIP